MIEAIIYREGTDDVTIWYPDLPKEAEDEISAILDRYRDRGCSVRGTMKEIQMEFLNS